MNILWSVVPILVVSPSFVFGRFEKKNYQFQNFINYHLELFCHCRTSEIDRPISMSSFCCKRDEIAHSVNESLKLSSFGNFFSQPHLNRFVLQLMHLFCDVCRKFYSILLSGRMWGIFFHLMKYIVLKKTLPPPSRYEFQYNWVLFSCQ